LRRAEPGRFASGYRKLAAEGAAAAHVLTFARGDATITIVPRLVWALARGGAPVGAVWGDTAIRLPSESSRRGFVNVLTGAAVDGPVLRLAEVLAVFPVALLVG
jgi:(1->4)-alpha-D-glucan 1-alpha-D-glucosylmutase